MKPTEQDNIETKLNDKSAPQADANSEESTKSGGGKIALGWLSNLRYGRSVSLSFFSRNAWLLVCILVVVIALIGLRYKTKTKMLEIRKLEKELVRAESAKLQEKSEYMSLIRESEMQRMVDERGLGLTFQEQPPYKLSLDD